MELPPFPELRLVIQRYADVCAALELTAGEQPLVLPNAEWFPDRFTGDASSLDQLIARLQGYAGLEAVKIEGQVVGETAGGSCGPSGCGSGACSPKAAPDGGDAKFELTRVGDGYVISAPAAALSNSLLLTTTLAGMMALLRLGKAEYQAIDGVNVELAAVALGFGVLFLESSHLYAKSCGGPSVTRATKLGCNQLALPFALFVAGEGHSIKPALAELAPTQRALVSEAWALADSNRPLVRRLAEAPEKVARGDFKLGEAQSWLARLFSSKKKAVPSSLDESALEALERGDDVDEIAALYASKPEARTSQRPPSREDDDLRALVDEALDELRGNRAGNDGRSAAE
jgi:hypothetical protein